MTKKNKRLHAIIWPVPLYRKKVLFCKKTLMACVSAISFLLDPFFLAIRYQSSVGPVGVIKSKDFDIFKVLTKFYLFTPSVFNLK